MWIFVLNFTDSGQNVTNLSEVNFQADSGRSENEFAGGAGDGVQTQSGLYGM